MEDSVSEGESLPHPVNPSSRDGVEEDGAKRGEEKAKGFINHLITNLVAADEPVTERKEEHGNHEQMKETVVEEKGGGLLRHFISNLVSPLSPKAGEQISQGKGEVFKINENECSRSEEDVASSPAPAGGGLIKNVISNLFHPSEADHKVAENGSNNQEENVKTEEDGIGGGAGIIDNVVSHSPKPLREDVAPTTDEASILIHSIIHD